MSDFRLPHDGWVVIADGEKALFLRNAGDAAFPNLEVFRVEEQDNPPAREQSATRRGRLNDTAFTGHRSAVGETDWHQLGKERFSKDICDILYRQAHRGAFKHLVLVAPPMVLGEMRKDLHDEVASKVIGDVDKTLTNHPIDEIERLVLH